MNSDSRKGSSSTAFKAIAVYTESGFTVDCISDSRAEDARGSGEGFYASFAERPYDALYEQAFSEFSASQVRSEYYASVGYLMEIARRVVLDISRSPDTDVSRAAPAPSREWLAEQARRVPYVIGSEFADEDWIGRVYAEVAAVFDREFAAFQGTAEEYFKAKNSGLNVAGRVFFHLVEYKDNEYPFAFLATYSDGGKGKVSHVPLKQFLSSNSPNSQNSPKTREDAQDKRDKLVKLLAAVSRAADRSSFISGLVESGELFSPLRFNQEEAYTFLKETPLYEECGVVCRIPNFWRRRSNARIKATVGAKEPSLVGLDALVEFSPSVFIGDEEFSRDEIEQLLAETSGLAFLKGKWVEVDPERLRSLLDALDKMDGEDISLADAIRMQSGLSLRQDGGGDEEIEVTNGEWLGELRAKMSDPALIAARGAGLRAGRSFRAELRGYQAAGLNWLYFMAQSRFGALLADDMGLGKTVQILALLDALRKRKIKTLLVIPASLITNWKKEAERFAPRLIVKILHGRERDFSPCDADLFVTTYAMAARIEQLSDYTWDLLILDEAQAIKNHGSKQTAAVKKLPAKSRIAMTGTPVENRLSDLWSIFDFLNKGLLGSQKEFADFTKELSGGGGENGGAASYDKLRGAVSPFILRRLKTDKSIIADLPEKAELKQYTTLTRKQTALYNQLVQELERAMESPDVSAIQRRGMILTGIMKFKQICNHPDQYLGNAEFAPKHSGKFETLSEICETIRDKRERVLVFTQFREMTAPIADYLAEVFGREGLVLHGGTPVKKRGELVGRMNGADYVPFMVLSLKAGGVGLNLTGANHVIHFDRWWNPAVENQATDRAFRIGQQRNVCVHKFVTAGTIEEKIDIIIENKQKLAGGVIPATGGENWITEMDNEDLFDLFRLEG